MSAFVLDFEDWALAKPKTGKAAAASKFEDFGFLLELPLGSHQHFAGIAIQELRGAVKSLNGRALKNDEAFHLVIRAVGESDPKGPGYRVLRDDSRGTRAKRGPKAELLAEAAE